MKDVVELCSRLAIIDHGRILPEAEPLRAIDAVRGAIWRRILDRAELPEVEQQEWNER